MRDIPVLLIGKQHCRNATLRECRGIVHIELNGFIKFINREFDLLTAAGINSLLGLQIQLINLRTRALRLCDQDVTTQKFRLQLLEYFVGDLVLNREDVGQLTIIGFRPQMKSVIDLNELRRDAHLSAGLANGPLENMGNAEGITDSAQVIIAPFERE